MSANVCTPSGLRNNCFQGQVIDPIRRKCLMIYLAAVEMEQLHYQVQYSTNLTNPGSGGLLGDATQGLQQVNTDLLGTRTIGLYELGIQYNNAVAAGMAAATIKTLMDKIKCLINVDEATLDKMLVWLTCGLGTHADNPI